jgi:tetratricopeptide (TPR) repeat protein
VAISLLNLGALEDSMGRMADAIPIYERALAIQRKALGEDAQDLAPTLHGIGAVKLRLARLGREKIGNEAAAAQLRKQIERWLRKHRAK